MLNDEENEEFSWSDIVQQANVTSCDEIENDDNVTSVSIFAGII